MTLTPRLLSPDANPQCQALPVPRWLLHDLMQPLNAFGLLQEQCREGFSPALKTDEQLRQYWEMMVGTVRQQEKLLQSLRTYLRLTAEPGPQTVRPLALSGILENLEENLRDHFPGLKIDFIGGNELSALSQQDGLLDILTRLAENAATHARSRVEIRIGAQAGQLEIDIRDDGPGLPPELIEVLGQPFLRCQSRPSAGHAGLGLGIHLAVTNAARLSGHRISLRETGDLGCCFTLCLPQAEASAGAPLTLADVDPVTGASILLIDPDEHFRQVLGKLLRSWHCTVEDFPDWTIPAAVSAPTIAIISRECVPAPLLADNASPYFIALPAHAGQVLSSDTLRSLHPLPAPLTPPRLRTALTKALTQTR